MTDARGVTSIGINSDVKNKDTYYAQLVDETTSKLKVMHVPHHLVKTALWIFALLTFAFLVVGGVFVYKFTSKPGYGEPGYADDIYTTWLLVGIAGLFIGGGCLIATLVVSCWQSDDNKVRKACHEEGGGLAFVVDDAQWRVFNQRQWGPGGREPRGLSFWQTMLAFPFLIGASMLIFYRKGLVTKIGVGAAIAIAVPVALILSFGVYFIERCRIRRQREFYSTHRVEVILGTSAICFGNEVFRPESCPRLRKVYRTKLVCFSEDEGALLAITWKSWKRDRWVLKTTYIPVPIGEENDMCDRVEAHVTAHSAFYLPNTEMTFAESFAKAKQDLAPQPQPQMQAAFNAAAPSYAPQGQAMAPSYAPQPQMQAANQMQPQAANGDLASQITSLNTLKNQGILTQAQFDAAVAKLM